MKIPDSVHLGHARSRQCGFSLLELLVAVTVLSVLLLLVAGMVDFFLSMSSSSRSAITGQQSARESVGYLTSRLSRATLNNYFDYVDAMGKFRSPANASAFVPNDYRLASDLHFVCGPASEILNLPAQEHPGSAVMFQASFGEQGGTSPDELDGLLNACGFFVEFAQNTGRPAFLDGLLPPEPFRYRLVEVTEPTESFSVFQSTKPLSGNTDYDRAWIGNLLSSTKRVVADNVILLLVLPKLSEAMEMELAGTSDGSYLAPEYLYDSRSWERTSPDGSPFERSFNALPPSLEVILVTISETAAKRLDSGSSPPLAEIFTGLFADSALLHPSPGDEGDLARMETRLQIQNIDYRVTRFEVPLQAARWTAPKTP